MKLRWAACALVVAVLAGCTQARYEDRVASPPPTPTGTSTGTATPDRPHPVSLQALMAKRYDGHGLRIRDEIARGDAYTRYAITYESGEFTISGVMNVPPGKGPFPVVVLAHGYIDPALYTTGRGLSREQDYLARRGYVVLHTDYRNHAQSDDDPAADRSLRLGYTEDVINAVLAVKRSTLPYLDRERVGLLGRSLGGGIVYNVLVVQPGLVDAAVVFAPVSSDTVKNFDRWIRPDRSRRQLAEAIIAAYGSPERNPEFWRNLSPVTFFGRVTEPLLMHHGTVDDTCPIAWSRETLAALQRAGKDVTLHEYAGENHAFGAAQLTAMRRTAAFFDQHLAP